MNHYNHEDYCQYSDEVQDDFFQEHQLKLYELYPKTIRLSGEMITEIKQLLDYENEFFGKNFSDIVRLALEEFLDAFYASK